MAQSITRSFCRDMLKTASLYHISDASGGQSYGVSADDTILGALVPLSRYQRALMGNDLSFRFLFFVDEEADIREQDKVEITEWDTITEANITVEYRVSHIDDFRYSGIRHRAAVLTKP